MFLLLYVCVSCYFDHDEVIRMAIDTKSHQLVAIKIQEKKWIERRNLGSSVRREINILGGEREYILRRRSLINSCSFPSFLTRTMYVCMVTPTIVLYYYIL